uniref:uncharacterized protein LOC122587799 n=1 Tax=Erigeron canadensis TaxID=72917 RepID=UPI001CB92F35|nr:uncharacterized protein LOC122587799 [Erigeron canadensis]
MGPICPIRELITPREIMAAGFSLYDTVADLIDGGAWKWPTAWLDLFPVLIKVRVPTFNMGQKDVLKWQDKGGKELIVKPSIVWESIRTHGNTVTWVNLVWFSKCIPRHSFLLWLVMKRKLKTHDRIKPWDVDGAYNLNLVCCSLCKTGPDSHIHLFFECPYSAQVWDKLKHMAGMSHLSNKLDDIVSFLIPKANGASTTSIIGRLVLAAAVYYIWQERNKRMFGNHTRPPDTLKDIIVENVRLRLASVKFKESSKTKRMLEVWRLPRSLLVEPDEQGRDT